MVKLKRIGNILRYGVGAEARRRKKAAKAAMRRERFESDSRWQRGADRAQRSYQSYQEYLEHQAAKLEHVRERRLHKEDIYFQSFLDRFRRCRGLVGARDVLCLGARLGTEVRAMHTLGYFAVGVDLNPGENNAYVVYGDFHRLVFPDDCVDAVYTNALDHVFELTGVLAEVRRVLRPGGAFVADVIAGFDEGFTPGAYESMHWSRAREFIESIRVTGGFDLEDVWEIGQVKRDHWTQAVLRKPSVATPAQATAR